MGEKEPWSRELTHFFNSLLRCEIHATEYNQNEQFLSYWTRSFEGPDRLNQVLSAHLAQVDRVSLLREPGLLRLTLFSFLFFFFPFAAKTLLGH
jgi:hypothetical protein